MRTYAGVTFRSTHTLKIFFQGLNVPVVESSFLENGMPKIIRYLNNIIISDWQEGGLFRYHITRSTVKNQFEPRLQSKFCINSYSFIRQRRNRSLNVIYVQRAFLLPLIEKDIRKNVLKIKLFTDRTKWMKRLILLAWFQH